MEIKTKWELVTECDYTDRNVVWLHIEEGLLDKIQCDRCKGIGLSIWNDGKIYCTNCRKIQD